MQLKQAPYKIILSCILLASLFISACHTGTDDKIILNQLKQQNAFLEKQIKQSQWILKFKAEGNYAARAYNKLYFKQDSAVALFLKGLATSDQDIDKKYSAFISRSNHYFDSANRQNATRFLPDDFLLLLTQTDSTLFLVKNDSLKRELIKQQVLQQDLVISQLCRSGTSGVGIRFDNPNHFGYRLTIEKNASHFLLNLKSHDPWKVPYFENMEFASLARNNKGDYYYSDDVTHIKTEVIDARYEKDAIVLKTKPLAKGFYKIYCKKLSISDDGRIIKRDAEFDFEITENQ